MTCRISLRRHSWWALSLFPLSVLATESLTLTWNPSPEPKAAKYRLYQGLSPDNLTESGLIPAAKTEARISNLSAGLTYYFAVSVLTHDGQESEISNILAYSVPSSSKPAPLIIKLAKAESVPGIPATTSVSLPTTDSFPVLSSGDVTNIVTTITSAQFNNFQYTWPTNQGRAGAFLQNDGAGNLSWSNLPKPPDLFDCLSFNPQYKNIGIGRVGSVDFLPFYISRNLDHAVLNKIENLSPSNSAAAIFTAASADSAGYTGAFPANAGASWRAGRFVMSAGAAPTKGIAIEALGPSQNIDFYAGGPARKASFSATGIDLFSELTVNTPTIGDPLLQLSSGKTPSDPLDLLFQVAGTTGDAIQTNITLRTLSSPGVYLFKAKVRARRVGGSRGSPDDSAAYIIVGSYKLVESNAVAVGSAPPSILYCAEDQSDWEATLTTKGPAVCLSVKGAEGNSINWHATIELSEL